MKLLTYITIMLCSTLFGQGISVRLFQPHDNTVFEGHLYKIIRIGSIRREDNGAETIDWKLWFLNDLRPYEKNNLLDMKTQKNIPGVGLFVNANYDSIFIIQKIFILYKYILNILSPFKLFYYILEHFQIHHRS